MQNVGKDFFHICRFVWLTYKLNMGLEFSKLVLHWQCTPIQTVTCKAYFLLYLILSPKIASNFWKFVSLKDCSTSLKISFNIRITTDELMHQRMVYESMHKKFKEKANEWTKVWTNAFLNWCMCEDKNQGFKGHVIKVYGNLCSYCGLITLQYNSMTQF